MATVSRRRSPSPSRSRSFVPSDATNWDTAEKITDQVFSLTVDGHLERWEVLQMTNIQRTGWMKRLTARAKAQKEARDRAQSK